MRLPDFRLETHFARWEFTAEHHLTASDAEAMSMRELLAFGTATQRDAFENLWLGYTETWGAPDLREAIAATYDTISANQILGFAGASEGIFAANNVLLDAEPCRGGDAQLPESRITALVHLPSHRCSARSRRRLVARC